VVLDQQHIIYLSEQLLLVSTTVGVMVEVVLVDMEVIIREKMAHQVSKAS
jgi:hypothetical protein